MNHDNIEDDQYLYKGSENEYKETNDSESTEPDIEIERSSSTLIQVKEKTNPDLNETSA